MYGVYSQVKFLKPPTSLFSRPGGHFFFPPVQSFGRCLFPSIGLGDIITHIVALTEFMEQALNDSWQSPSLLNAEMSLRKAILRNRMALDIVTAWQGGTCAITHTDVVICT